MKKDVQSALSALNIKYGHGKRLKRPEKEVKKPWLVGQMYQTLDRLLPEPDLRQERACLLFALKALGIR